MPQRKCEHDTQTEQSAAYNAVQWARKPHQGHVTSGPAPTVTMTIPFAEGKALHNTTQNMGMQQTELQRELATLKKRVSSQQHPQTQQIFSAEGQLTTRNSAVHNTNKPPTLRHAAPQVGTMSSENHRAKNRGRAPPQNQEEDHRATLLTANNASVPTSWPKIVKESTASKKPSANRS